MQFIDLNKQQSLLYDIINANIQSVLEHGIYIMGPEVKELESKLCEFGNSKHALSCANGTDALMLVLMAWGVGPGDAVFCPSFTYCATAEAIAVLGATPVFVDIDATTYNMSGQSLKEAITTTLKNPSLKAKAVIVVDIFGQSANYPTLAPIARAHGLKIIADSAQSFGTQINGHQPLHWVDATTTSFFPAKPLGCYGDGGAVLTNNSDDYEAINSLRVHGKGKTKYDNVRIGLNSRLDTLQAAILLPKLAIFPEEIKRRNDIASRYINGLKDYVCKVPHIIDGAISTWAQFTIETPDPIALGQTLRADNIPTARYYPIPVHQQPAYSDFPTSPDGLRNTVDIVDHIISLPMHPYLEEKVQNKIINAVKKHAK